MATELGKFISQELEKLPSDHEDRKFLEEKLAETKQWQISKSEEVIKAKKEIEKLVEISNKQHGGCTIGLLQKNEWFKKRMINEHGEESVATLLPTDCFLYMQVMSTIIIKGDNKLTTKEGLINLTEKDIRAFRTTEPIQVGIIDAMRDLAIAQHNAKNSK